MNAKFEFLQNNPKRCPSASYDRYERYKTATCLREMLALGGSRADYKNDLGKGYIKLEGMADFAPVDVKRKAPPAPSAFAPPPAQPRTKKVKGAPGASSSSAAVGSSSAGGPPPAPKAPKQAGFVIYSKVDTKMMSWDDKTFAGRSPAEMQIAKDETETAARRHDGMSVIATTVYDSLEDANKAALDLILKIVDDLSEETATLKPCEDMIVPSAGTILNSCSKAENGCAMYRTAIHLSVDAMRIGAENLSRTSVTVKTIYQSG